MRAEILKRFSRDKLIELILRADKRIDFLAGKLKRQEKVGYIYFNDKKYNIIFEREE